MKKRRILLGKPGLDGHDRGIMVLATAFRDAGYEVIYTGIRRSPEEIVKMAIEEDVDVLGLSNLSGAHIPLFPRVAKLLRESGGNDILLICGGIIPKEDFKELEESGFARVFTSGSTLKEILAFVDAKLKKEEK